MTYRVEFTLQALEDLPRLDAAVARRIAEKIQWLAEHFDQIQPETLTGSFAALFKLRIGDWRVLYTTDVAERIITVHVIAIAARFISHSVSIGILSDCWCAPRTASGKRSICHKASTSNTASVA